MYKNQTMKQCKIEFICGTLKGIITYTNVFDPKIGKIYKPTSSHFIVLEIVGE